MRQDLIDKYEKENKEMRDRLTKERDEIGARL